MSSEVGDPPAKVSRKRQLRRWIVGILRIAALVYLGLTVFFYFFQNRIIFPGAATQGRPDATLKQGYDNELVWLHAPDGTPIAAIFGKALWSEGQPLADAHHRPTVIYFYGNGACMAYSTDIFDHLRRLGVNVIIPDFEGYGMSGGKPSESGCYAAADAAYDYLLSRDDIDPKKIVAMGWSMGGAAAIDLASRRPIDGLITISAFTNLRDMGHQLISWIPTSLLLKYRFDNETKLAGISCPILIIHGLDDDLVPPYMADRLAAAAKGKVTRYDVRNAGHNDVFEVGGDDLYKKIAEFIQTLP